MSGVEGDTGEAPRRHAEAVGFRAARVVVAATLLALGGLALRPPALSAPQLFERYQAAKRHGMHDVGDHYVMILCEGEGSPARCDARSIAAMALIQVIQGAGALTVVGLALWARRRRSIAPVAVGLGAAAITFAAAAATVYVLLHRTLSVDGIVVVVGSLIGLLVLFGLLLRRRPSFEYWAVPVTFVLLFSVFSAATGPLTYAASMSDGIRAYWNTSVILSLLARVLGLLLGGVPVMMSLLAFGPAKELRRR